ncbi:MAG TPA: GspE/PulE family protein [Acidimicrobiia bacterium]|nr:GspE/PulE family protein [Acidimicrobiia bacterium]
MRLRRGQTAVDDDARAVAPEPSSSAPAAGAQPTRRLGDLLVEQELVSQAELMEGLLEQSASGGRLGSVLVKLGMLDERDLARVLSEQQGLPLVDLRQDVPEASALERLPESVARSMHAIPIRETPDGLLIAVADSEEHDAYRVLSQAVGGPVVLVIAPPSDIARAIDGSYRALAGVDEQVRRFEAVGGVRARTAGPQVEVADDHAPVVQVVNLVITQALRDRASDIHLEPQGDVVRVRFRIDGALHEVQALPAEMGPAVVSRIKVLAGMNIVERRRAQDGQLEMTIDGRDLDVRVSTVPTIHGEKAVLRLLDKSRSLFELDQLGMPDSTRATYSALTRHPYGMVIVAGPTGSGKTTTLYATLAQLNTPDRNLTTIEDPVEYVFPSINQIQINEQAGVTFADGLKSILRQDPDVILVGEMRDVETARIAVQSALTGHFVLSSIHATDAASALHRFLDMGLESFLIASSVLGIVAQRLVRRTCTHCRVRYEPTPEERMFYEHASSSSKSEFWHGAGCNFCSHTGFEDRIGVFELLRCTDEMRDLIVSSSSHDRIRELAVEQGMVPMREEALRLVEEDVTTIAEILRGVYLI